MKSKQSINWSKVNYKNCYVLILELINFDATLSKKEKSKNKY